MYFNESTFRCFSLDIVVTADKFSVNQNREVGRDVSESHSVSNLLCSQLMGYTGT